MLTDIQQKLLQMMKELDEVCRANGIHYTLGGGTAIGAIRHRGFLPWDDDIDLYMTRDNWEKFKAVGDAGGLPPNRVIESAETDDRYTNTMGRYVTTDSSSVHSHQIIGRDPAGHVLDVFVFDPLHFDNYEKYLEDLMLFADLMDESKSYSSRLDMNLKRYPAALKRCGKEGRKPVVEELIDSFTHMDKPGWQHYIMEWGTAPFLFPASIFDGGYVRVPFEDTTVEIVRNYIEYLIWQYGFEWAYVPEHTGREGHEAIFSNTIPYTKVREDYLPFIDEEALHKAYLRRKLRLLKANPHRRGSEKAAAEKKAAGCAEALKKKISDRGLDADSLREMLSSGKYGELSEIFEDYISLQLGPEFAGRRDKHSTLRAYMHPVFVPVDRETAEVAAEYLMKTERMGKASRLICLYTGDYEENLTAERRDPGRLADLREEINETGRLLNEAAAAENRKAVYEETAAACTRYADNSRLLRLRLGMLLEDRSLSDEPDRDIREMLAKLAELIPEDSPAYGEYLKLKADYEDSGSDTYREIYGKTNNGCVKLAISDLLASRGEPLEEESEENGIDDESNEASVTPQVKSACGRASLYLLARGIYRKIARKDDRLKERAWEIACRTRDRVVLLEKYGDRIPELRKMMSDGEWDRLSEELKTHEEAMLRDLGLGLGLCVHPELSDIQYEAFRHDGRTGLPEEIDRLVPEQHRKPIA